MTKRFEYGFGTQVECTVADEFVAKVLELCTEYGVRICHEDEHGAFIIKTNLDQGTEADRPDTWFSEAVIDSAKDMTANYQRLVNERQAKADLAAGEKLKDMLDESRARRCQIGGMGWKG